MKNKIIIFALLLASLGSMTGCQDRLRDEFQDPEKHAPSPEEIIPGMLTQLQYTSFFVQGYGHWYWLLNVETGLPAHTQLAMIPPIPSWSGDFDYWEVFDGSGFFNNEGNYNQAHTRFNGYYTEMKNWGLMRDELSVLSGQEFTDNEPFFLAATVLKDAVGMQTVDIFNRIPYKDGFGGTLGVFFPKYDDAKEIYTTILTELASLAQRFPAAYDAMSDAAKASFAHNDLAFKGDPEKWVQYCNALILRHGLRMSGVDEAFVKPLIAEAVKNLPKEDFIWDNPQVNQVTFANGGNGGIMSRGLEEMAYVTYIPNTIMDRMNLGGIEYVPGQDDPRLPVLANPTRYNPDNQSLRYVGITMNYDKAYEYWPTDNGAKVPEGSPEGSYVDYGPGQTLRIFDYRPRARLNAWLASDYSTYNLATFIHGNIPSYMTSLAEIDLQLAEVKAKGYAATPLSAEDHVRESVIHSTDMWYKVNANTHMWQASGFPAKTPLLANAFTPDKPSSAVIGQFADIVKQQMADAAGDIEQQMEIIMEQKYVHLNILGMYDLWAELRRTRHPKLEKLTVGGTTYSAMLERTFYPSSELQNNTESYYEVQSEDNCTSPIFWVPAAKRSESYYMDGYLPTPGFGVLPTPNPNKTDMGAAVQLNVLPTFVN